MSQDFATRRKLLRACVRGAYDLQKLRISSGNRLATNFAAKLGLDLTKKGRPGKEGPGRPELDTDMVKKLMKRIKGSYERITDAIVNADFDADENLEIEVGEALEARGLPVAPTLPREKKFKGDEVISDYAELILVHSYVTLLKNEQTAFKALHVKLMEFPIYSQWLLHVVGVGPQMSGVIISEIDITKAATASAIWKLCGLDVAPDGAGRSKRAEHLIKKAYVNADGEPDERNSITFNPFLKTKMRGVLGSVFVKQKPDRCKYRRIYDEYKAKLEVHPKWGIHMDEVEAPKGPDGKAQMWLKASKGHRHNMAIRYAVKQFLLDLYLAWRKIEGLPIAPKPEFAAKA